MEKSPAQHVPVPGLMLRTRVPLSATQVIVHAGGLRKPLVSAGFGVPYPKPSTLSFARATLPTGPLAAIHGAHGASFPDADASPLLSMHTKDESRIDTSMNSPPGMKTKSSGALIGTRVRNGARW